MSSTVPKKETDYTKAETFDHKQSPLSAIQIIQQEKHNVATGRRVGSSSRRVCPIVSLNPYISSWSIKVKVASKSPLRPFSNSKVSGNILKVEFVDQDGTAIEAVMWREAADKFNNVLEEGKVYYVSNGTLKMANKQYSNVKNDYEMTLNVNSTVEEVPEVDSSWAGQAVQYNFVKIDQLGPYVGGRPLVDVVGLVSQVTSVVTIRRKSDGDEVARRELTLLDDSSKSAVVTLWGDLAQNDGAKLAEMAAESNTVVVALKYLRVGDYQGLSLGTTSRTTVTLNPDIPEATQLKEWFEAEGKSAIIVPAGQGLLGSGTRAGGRSGSEERLYLGSISPSLGEEKVAYFNLLLTVGLMKHDQPMYYQACEKCSRKVLDNDGSGSFWCEGCGQSYSSCKRRYIVSFKAMDATGETWATAFNEQAEQILGVSADELAEAREQEDGKYKGLLKHATWQSYFARMSVEVSEYKGEKRQRFRVRSLSGVDWVAESSRLLQLIQGL